MKKMQSVKPCITDFQSRVYDILSGVPRGFVTTYAALARAVGCGSPRAVGQALRRNPFAPRVPCHRVVRGDRSLGGFCGEDSGPPCESKLKLLLEEGVRFDDRRRVESSCVIKSLSLDLLHRRGH